jgi:hypothetical protein
VQRERVPREPLPSAREQRRPPGRDQGHRPRRDADQLAGREPEEHESDDRQSPPERTVVDVDGERWPVRAEAERPAIRQPTDRARGHRRQQEMAHEIDHREIQLLGDHQVGEVGHGQRARGEAGEERGLEGEHRRRVVVAHGDADVQRREQHDGGVEVEHDRHRGGEQPQPPDEPWAALDARGERLEQARPVEQHGQWDGEDQEQQRLGQRLEGVAGGPPSDPPGGQREDRARRGAEPDRQPRRPCIDGRDADRQQHQLGHQTFTAG